MRLMQCKRAIYGIVSRVANWAMVEVNWRVGFLIFEDEQTFPIRDALRHELSWTYYRILRPFG